MSTRDCRSSASCRTNVRASARERMSTERADGIPSAAARRALLARLGVDFHVLPRRFGDSVRRPKRLRCVDSELVLPHSRKWLATEPT
eukprot:scaffold119937_cov21-Phaeocystis_antarctica.AAC.1